MAENGENADEEIQEYSYDAELNLSDTEEPDAEAADTSAAGDGLEDPVAEIQEYSYDAELNLSDTEEPDGDAEAADTSAAGDGLEDPELEAIKARVREMEEEAEKLKEMQSEVEKQMNLSSSSATSPTAMSVEEKLDADGRSIWCGNVDYGATAEELEAHFHGCGSVNRVTILCDKFTGHPKGFGYVEFTDKDSVQTAMALDESLFRGRQIKVTAKRTNRPGITSTNRAPRGGRMRRPRTSYYQYGGYQPRPRGRGAFRSRRTSYYSPY